MTIDVGTGDGRAVLATAATEPTTLAIGLDAIAAPMAEASARAARAPAKGGRSNALFVLAAAESLPPELHEIAARVTVRFPWASLLRGCLGAAPAVAGGVASLIARDGTLELLLAPTARDRLDALPTDLEGVRGAVAAAFAPAGLAIVEGRTATPIEIADSGSTWARRLLGSRHVAGTSGRAVFLVRLRR